MPTSDRGFTLLEVLAVVLLLALLTTTVLPQVTLRTGADLEAESRALAGTLEYAFERAAATGETHRVVLDFDEQWYREGFGRAVVRGTIGNVVSIPCFLLAYLSIV